jgi:hypothetical protein
MMYKQDYDVIVIGGGPGGLPAAIAASRMGVKTLLIERSSILGGLAVSLLPLLGFIDRTGRQVLGGIPQEFVNRINEDQGTLGHIRCPVHNSLTIINPAWFRITAFEMCREADVDVMLYSELVSLRVDNGKVTGVTALCRGETRSYQASIIIDATGDGCAAFFAGAHYKKGNTMQPPSLTFSIGNVNLDVFLRYLKANPETMRLPDTYGVHQTDEQFFSSRGFAFTGFKELIDKARAAGDYTLPRDRVIFTTLPNRGEVLVNTTRALGIDSTDVDSVIKGEFECHRQIKELMRFFKKYAPGFEDCFLSSIAPCLGSRESRRICGIKTLTDSALKNCDVPEDTVVLAGYNVDVHVPETEKLYLQPVEHAIGIPYGCMVSDSVEGLMMAGRCISVDGDIYGLTRIMGTCMGTGEAAGTAAALGIRQKISPKALDVDLLRKTLIEKGVVL